jgi:hypothetical protein
MRGRRSPRDLEWGIPRPIEGWEENAVCLVEAVIGISRRRLNGRRSMATRRLARLVARPKHPLYFSLARQYSFHAYYLAGCCWVWVKHLTN